MANANLFQQYLQPVKSVQDYSNEMAQSEGNQLELAAKRQGVQDDMATRAAFQASGGDQANALQRLTQGGQYKAAQALQKSMLDAQKAQSDIGLATSHAKSFESTARKTDQEVKFAAAVDHAKALNYVKSPQDVISYFDQGIAKGVFPADQRDQMIAQADKYPTLEAWKQAELNASIPVLEKFKTDAENSRNAATNATSRENNQATVGATLAGQQSTAATAAAGRAQADRHFNASQAAANQSVTYQSDANGNLVALPSKVAPGAGISALPVIGANGKPMQGAGNKPTADFLKQSEAYQNMDDALTDYSSKLKNMSALGFLSPSARADMGTSYNNAMLQAKEIYKLGVLNGGDERILKSILNSPLDWSSAITPKSALLKQAEDLRGIISRGNQRLSQVNKQPTNELPSAANQKPAGGGFKYLGSE